jgi:hypothetical protein
MDTGIAEDRRPFTPVIALSSPEDRRACCGVLKIQAHMPDCTGEVRRPSRARRS